MNSSRFHGWLAREQTTCSASTPCPHPRARPWAGRARRHRQRRYGPGATAATRTVRPRAASTVGGVVPVGNWGGGDHRGVLPFGRQAVRRHHASGRARRSCSRMRSRETDEDGACGPRARRVPGPRTHGRGDLRGCPRGAPPVPAARMRPLAWGRPPGAGSGAVDEGGVVGRRPTLDDLARRTGVSRTVASRAVNGEPNVSPAKPRAAVARAVAEARFRAERDGPCARDECARGAAGPRRLRATTPRWWPTRSTSR